MMTRRLTWLIVAALTLLLGGAEAPARIIGGPFTGGCILGAQRLPTQGEGFETIHLNRSSFWGAPETIERIEQLGRGVHQAGLPDAYVEDISRRYGGPLPGGHLSHQVGLDADIGLDMRPRPKLPQTELENVELPTLVQPDGRAVLADRWSERVVTLLHLAASLPEVDRILVNPAIKKQLCQTVTGDRAWLHLIRPWYGHAAHMHIRFRCPPGQTECQQAGPPPAGDGCDQTLQWWFDQIDHPSPPSGAPERVPVPPAACKAVLAGG